MSDYVTIDLAQVDGLLLDVVEHCSTDQVRGRAAVSASQIRTFTSVLRSQKKGKAKSSEKTAPPRYTGFRPSLSESAP